MHTNALTFNTCICPVSVVLPVARWDDSASPCAPAASKRIQTIVCPNQPQSSFRRLLAGPSLSSHLAAHAKGHAVLFVN